jgi:GNAT superfamily N-acetyltransferase
MEIRCTESDGDFTGYAEVWNAITPSEPITVAGTAKSARPAEWLDMPMPEPTPAPPYDDWAPRLASPEVLEHGFTAVLRSHRGRGIAIALKRTQLTWAAEHGCRELITYTQEGNEPMRAINKQLGYRERPAWILVRRKAV